MVYNQFLISLLFSPAFGLRLLQPGPFSLLGSQAGTKAIGSFCVFLLETSEWISHGIKGFKNDPFRGILNISNKREVIS